MKDFKETTNTGLGSDLPKVVQGTNANYEEYQHDAIGIVANGINKQIENNRLENNRLVFNSKGHRYTLDGKPITGVTTILRVISKPALIQWAANMAVDYILEKAKWNDPFLKEEKYNKILTEARKAYAQKRDKAGDIGTLAHKQIERWIKKQAPEPVSEQIKKMVDNFIDWAKKNKVKFLASEKMVYSEKYFFCGTYDFLCEIDGKIWLGDIKTSSGIYPEYFFQTAGYQICEEEMNPNLKIDGHLIVNIKKDGTINEKRSVSNKNNQKAFLSALNLYRIIEQVSKTTL